MLQPLLGSAMRLQRVPAWQSAGQALSMVSAGVVSWSGLLKWSPESTHVVPGPSRCCRDLPAAYGCWHLPVAKLACSQSAAQQAVWHATQPRCLLAGQLLASLHAGAVQDALTDQYTDQLRDLREAGLAEQTEQVWQWLACVRMSLPQLAARLQS